jgi:hypothetical protein
LQNISVIACPSVEECFALSTTSSNFAGIIEGYHLK